MSFNERVRRDFPDVLTFPIEFYISTDTIQLYQTIEGKTFTTRVTINDETNTVLVNGESMTVVQFIADLKDNRGALELQAPLQSFPERLVVENMTLRSPQ